MSCGRRLCNLELLPCKHNDISDIEYKSLDVSHALPLVLDINVSLAIVIYLEVGSFYTSITVLAATFFLWRRSDEMLG